MPTYYEEAIAQTLAQMEGWCSLDKAMKVSNLITTESLRRCVEIGVFGGRSVVAMALAQQRANIDGYVVGIDPWRNADCLECSIKTAARIPYDGGSEF